MEPCTGGQTPAVIWEISTDEERVLDRYEGFPKHYRKENIVVDLDGSPVSTTAYIMTKWKKTEDSRAQLAPDEKYLAHIRQGYLENGFTETLPV
ncbi:MAG: hypothetical protein GX325_10180 [Peptococcaceae bacterium]|nr:hypothetical protein [Peptococcaceae bacterium]